MITLIFMDCECDYDNHIILFFETLKNHVEDFKCETKIDLRGIKIRKEEFDNILNMCETFVWDNEITKIENNDRQEEIEDYLGIFLGHNNGQILMEYCAENGLLDILKYIHEDSPYSHDTNTWWNADTCSHAAMNGHIDCLKYARENGCPWNEDTCSQTVIDGHIDCLKYAHENKCPWDEKTCINAAANGQFECLEYAHENKCPWDAKTCIHALKHGHIKCLKYAYEHGCIDGGNSLHCWKKWVKYDSKNMYLLLTDECKEYFVITMP